MAADSTSVWLGVLIRRRRKQLGLTQKDVAERLGLTAQQIQKYESGTDTLRVTRLLEFSRVLDYSFESALLSFAKMQEQGLPLPLDKPTEVTVAEDQAPFQSKNSKDTAKNDSADSSSQRKSRKQKEEDGSLTVVELETFFEQFLALDPTSQRSVAQLVAGLDEKRKK